MSYVFQHSFRNQATSRSSVNSHQFHFKQHSSFMATLITLYLCLLQITLSGLRFKLVQSDTYIVHMDISAMPKVFSDHHNWYAATLSSISDDLHHTSTIATIPKLIYTYNSVTHGFCASLSSSQLGLLQKTPGFIYSIRDVPVKAHSTHTAEFLGLNSNYGAWPESEYGKDVIIGVIDSGVWPESESYRDHGMTEIPSRWRGKCISDISFNSSMCNKKLIGARFYNKGLINNRTDVNITVNSTRDTYGHGTHTSSIAAGNYVEGASFFGYAQGTSKGIAPRACLAIYKALWDNHAYASDVIAAIDQAIEDGVDILSISMDWGRYVLYEDPIAIATFAAMQKGIFVATSAGNDGSVPYSVDNGAPWVLTVGGSSVDRLFSGTIILGNEISVIGESLYLGSSLNKVPLVYMSNCLDEEALKKVGHKIVVCEGGSDYDLPDIIDDVKSAHVAGAIFICTTDHMEQYLQSSFPATFVNPHDGQPILDYINKSTDPKVTLEFYKTKIGTKPAPVVGEYGGRGPSASCPSVLKPDLVAPGTTILASWPPNIPVMNPAGSDGMFIPFNILTGTSMACPHVAGVAALLKGKHPEWSPAAIRSAMMTIADVFDNTLNPVSDFAHDFGNLPPASALAMGSGHINPNKALDPGLIYDAKAEDYVRFLCSTNFTKNQIKMITRSSPLNCSNPSSDINYPSFIAFFNANKSSSITQSVQEFRRTLTNVGDGMSTYIANLTQMNEVKVSVFPKKLFFRRKYETLSFTLTIKGLSRLNDMAVDGSISWIDVKGKHVVRSPIVATRLNPDDIEG